MEAEMADGVDDTNEDVENETYNMFKYQFANSSKGEISFPDISTSTLDVKRLAEAISKPMFPKLDSIESKASIFKYTFSNAGITDTIDMKPLTEISFPKDKKQQTKILPDIVARKKLKTKNFYLAVSTAQNTNEYIADRKRLLESFIPDVDSYNLFFDNLMKVVKPNTLYQLFGIWSKNKSYKVIKLPRLLCKFSTFMKKRMCKDDYMLNTEWDEIKKLLESKGCEIVYINTEADFESLYFRLKDDK